MTCRLDNLVFYAIIKKPSSYWNERHNAKLFGRITGAGDQNMQNRIHCLAGLPARRNSGREGLTLIEVMLVLVILMTLATVGMLAVNRTMKQANIRKANVDLSEFARLLDQYELEFGFFPSTDEGLNALCECPPSAPDNWYQIAKWNSPPLDPWKNQYMYQHPGSQGSDSFDLWSNGPDRISGTDDDIWYKR